MCRGSVAEEEVAAPVAGANKRRPAISLADIPFEETRAPEPAGPPFSALLEGGDKRQRWLKHWIGDPIQGAINHGTHAALRPIPAGACSWLGAFLAPLARRYNAKRIFAQRIEHNLKALRPDLATNPAAAGRALAGWWRNVGRVYAEFSAIDRFWEEGRVELAGREHLEAALASGRPLILPSVHLGTWEAIGVAMVKGLNLPVIGVYQPQPSRFSNRIIYRVRQRYGVKVLPPGQRTARQLHRLVGGNHAHLVMFIDEERANQSHVPLFGRPIPQRGNAVTVVKLARAAKAMLLPVHMLRVGGTRFRLTFMAPMELVESGDARADIARNVERISARFEPLIRENIEQWYMLAELRLPPTRQ